MRGTGGMEYRQTPPAVQSDPWGSLGVGANPARSCGTAAVCTDTPLPMPPSVKPFNAPPQCTSLLHCPPINPFNAPQ